MPRCVQGDGLYNIPKSGTVFVSSMGDMWGEWVPEHWIIKVLDFIVNSPKATFLFLTKNPARYHEFLPLPENSIAGATIETNQADLLVNNAPEPGDRYLAMKTLKHPRKFLSIEPIMRFDLKVLVEWVQAIAPEFVYIGYDNHNHHLPEPSKVEVGRLVYALSLITEVRLKTIRECWNAPD